MIYTPRITKTILIITATTAADWKAQIPAATAETTAKTMVFLDRALVTLSRDSIRISVTIPVNTGFPDANIIGRPDAASRIKRVSKLFNGIKKNIRYNMAKIAAGM
jgi:hypothetical protein